MSEITGQWHYVLGYLVILIGHNWPIMLSVILSVWQSVRLYRRPTRANVCLFYSCLLTGITYEYHKHVAQELHTAIDFLFGAEILYLNIPAHVLVGPIVTGALIALTFGFLGRGLWLLMTDSGHGAADATELRVASME
jgi:hypothetical protein